MASEDELTLSQIYRMTLGSLPEGWSLSLTIARDEVSLDLIDPDGETVVDVYDGGRDSTDCFLAHVNHAREAEELEPIGEPRTCPECKGSGKGERDPSGGFYADCPACGGKEFIVPYAGAEWA